MHFTNKCISRKAEKHTEINRNGDIRNGPETARYIIV